MIGSEDQVKSGDPTRFLGARSLKPGGTCLVDEKPFVAEEGDIELCVEIKGGPGLPSVTHAYLMRFTPKADGTEEAAAVGAGDGSKRRRTRAVSLSKRATRK